MQFSTAAGCPRPSPPRIDFVLSGRTTNSPSTAQLLTDRRPHRNDSVQPANLVERVSKMGFVSGHDFSRAEIINQVNGLQPLRESHLGLHQFRICFRASQTGSHASCLHRGCIPHRPLEAIVRARMRIAGVSPAIRRLCIPRSRARRTRPGTPSNQGQNFLAIAIIVWGTERGGQIAPA